MPKRSLRRTALKTVAAVAAMTLPLGLAACGGGGSSSNSKTVTLWTSVDPLIFAGFKKQIQAEAKAEGITVDIQKVDNINQLIMTKVQANDAPDIAMIPQPGVVADLVTRGAAHPLDSIVDMNELKQNMTPGTLEAGTVNGKLYGLLANMNIKSLVYYPKQAWDKAGYKVPKTIPELNALTDQIKKDGGTPWCFAIGASGATGWPATDWIEELLAKYSGPTVYNDWVTHKVKFDSSQVKQAAAEFQKLIFTKGNVYGGLGSVANTDFGNADDPMWKNPPGCWMLKQGNFIVSKDFMPTGIVGNVDKNIGVFGFPPATAGGQNPVVGGGDMATLLSTNPNAAKVIKLMSEPNWGKDAAPTSSYISPHTNFDMSLYPSNLTKETANIAYKSSTFLFDGSDSMPGAVGAGTFWKDMTAWISGQESLDTALKNIDASWPTT